MIKAIIFDCFGVLTTDGWLPYKNRHFGSDEELRQHATILNRQVDAGLISYDDFIRGVADLASLPVAEAKKQIEDNVANQPLFETIQRLKPKYKIGFLSNAGANWTHELFSPEQVELFDVVCVSSETGHVKPEERAYLDVTEKLGLEPEECLFVDDQPRYCAAAEEVGMRAIVYRDFEQYKSELEKLLQTA
jgi:HAD superfamily hydrolase (TIGR01509 family)